MENANERDEELLAQGEQSEADVEALTSADVTEAENEITEDSATDSIESDEFDEGDGGEDEAAGKQDLTDEPEATDGVAESESEAPVEKRTFAEKLFDFSELFVFTLATVILLLSFVFRHAEVKGHSMDTTLANGEHLIISDLFYTPRRGDIVVFSDYSTIYREPLIKRIIAIGGDTVKISGGVVYVNGEPLDESDYIDDVYMKNFNEITVPYGEVFVMGDNRDESDDSRNPLIGTIDEDAILGKVIFRFFPFDSFGSVK